VLREPERGRPRITAPAGGVIIALDPDIPWSSQVVMFETRGASPAMTLTLDGATVAPAGAPAPWHPLPGYHTLALVDATGSTLDRVRFTVRGAP
jgi:penicillin-binding protein 1C